MTMTRRQLVAAIPAAALAANLPRGARAEERKVVTFWFGQANSDGQAALRNDLVEAFNASQDKYLLQMEVQVAAVNQRADADTIARRLTGKGYPAFVTTPAGAANVFRVRVGSYPDRREAESVAGRLEKEEQFKPWVTR